MIPLTYESKMPLYLQITNGIINQILKGRIGPGTKMPGSRIMAEQLGVHRNTIITSYEELESQGWINARPAKGNFVNDKLPVLKKIKISSLSKKADALKKSGFVLNTVNKVSSNFGLLRTKAYDLHFDDGCPDVRIAPITSLAKHYKGLLNSTSKHQFDYTWHLQGTPRLREQLVTYLSETRGINVTIENILITRGSLMGFYLLFQNLLSQGDKVVVGETSYEPVNQIIKNFKGNLLKVPVDKDGINIDALEILCKKNKIKAVYVSPHHHHPTTVTLSCARRMQLLSLSELYNFAIVEDDYDYDFHYKSSPILPLMSSDENGLVVYTGSFSKSLAPAFRLGYLVAPENVIQALSHSRRYIDRQGDILMESALAMMMKEGELKRHLRKALVIYRNRRNHFCELLSSELKNQIQFKIPEGGLATWVSFDNSIDLALMTEKAARKGLFMVNPNVYNSHICNSYSSRLGFASMNEDELTKSVAILKNVLT